MANYLSELDKRAEDAKEAAEELREAVRSFQSWTTTAGKQAEDAQKKIQLLSEDINKAYLSIEELANKANSRIDSAVSDIRATAEEHVHSMQNRLNQLAEDINATHMSLDESGKQNTAQMKAVLTVMKNNYECALKKHQKAMEIKVNRLIACVAFSAGVVSAFICFSIYLILT